MRITIQRTALRRVVDATRGASDSKSAVKALAHILLVVDDGTIDATATDLYRAARMSVPCDVVKPGRVCLNAVELFERVKKLPDGPVEIDASDTTVTLRANGRAQRYTLPCLPPGEFPRLPFDSAPSAASLAMPAATLDALISSTFSGVSTDVTRPYINSAQFEWTAASVRMASTDGHRVFVRDAANASNGDGEFLIPLAALTEVRRLVADAPEGTRVSLSYSASWAHLSIDDGLTFSFNTPAAQFPPYDRVIASLGETTTPCRVNRAAFATAVANVAVAAGDKTGGVKLTFAPSVVRIVAESAESGSGFDEVPTTYAGPEVSVGMNARYLADALAGVDVDDVEIGVGRCAEDPISVRAEGYTAMISPMRM